MALPACVPFDVMLGPLELKAQVSGDCATLTRLGAPPTVVLRYTTRCPADPPAEAPPDAVGNHTYPPSPGHTAGLAHTPSFPSMAPTVSSPPPTPLR